MVLVVAFRIPTTVPFDFEQTYPVQGVRCVQDLKQANSCRVALERKLNGQSVASDVIEQIERYLPLLLGVRAAHAEYVNPDASKLSNKLKARWAAARGKTPMFKWTSALTIQQPSPWYASRAPSFELASVLLTLAVLHANSGANHWHKTVSEEDFDGNSKNAAHELKVAAGVFAYVGNTALLEPIPEFVSEQMRPPELCEQMCRALSSVCLAQAQKVTLRKAVRMQTSAKVMAKLAMGVSSLFEAANTQMVAMGNNLGAVSPFLRQYVATMVEAYKGVALRYQAEHAHGEDRYGESVVLSRRAWQQLTATRTALQQNTLQVPTILPIVGEVDAEVADVLELFQEYNKENDSIYYDTEPDFATLPPIAPHVLVKAEPFTPPQPAFVTLNTPAPATPPKASAPAESDSDDSDDEGTDKKGKKKKGKKKKKKDKKGGSAEGNGEGSHEGAVAAEPPIVLAPPAAFA